MSCLDSESFRLSDNGKEVSIVSTPGIVSKEMFLPYACNSTNARGPGSIPKREGIEQATLLSCESRL